MKNFFSITTRRQAMVQAAGLAILAATGSAHAQAWPSKPVSLVVPFPPGGTTDVLARTLAESLSPVLGQPVIVENRPGAGATIGANFVAKSRPDGHTLLVGAVHHTIASSVYDKLPYDFQKDLAPITTIAMVPNVLVVQTATTVDNVQDLVKLLKSRPGMDSYGSNGNGTAQHLIGTQFQTATGTQLTHVPYRGSGPLSAALLGGQVLMSFDTITPSLPHIKAGTMRPIAVTTATRSAALPDVPTLQEAGLKNFDIGTWFGVLAPVATPKVVLDRLNAEMVKIIKSPEFGKRMEAIGAQPIGDSAEAMAKRIAEETTKFGEIVRMANITVD